MSAKNHPNHTAEVPMLMPPWLERFQIKFVNPVVGLFAKRVPALGIVKHRGRTSGTPYETIVTPFRKGDVVAIGLMHGKTNWVKNVLAAGEAEIQLGGRDLRLTNPRVVPVGTTGDAVADLPKQAQKLLRREGVFVADIG